MTRRILRTLLALTGAIVVDSAAALYVALKYGERALADAPSAPPMPCDNWSDAQYERVFDGIVRRCYL